jgi:hypothetical protein
MANTKPNQPNPVHPQMMQQPNARPNNYRPNNTNLVQPQAAPIAQIQTPAPINSQMEMVRNKAQQPMSNNVSVATKRKLADTMYANQQAHNSVLPPHAQQGMLQNMNQHQSRSMPQSSKS